MAILLSNQIEKRIYFLRKQRVMLSMDLAKLYGVAPKILVQAVKRNIERFPGDFMFQLNLQEVRNLKSQIVTSSWGGQRFRPYAFTEQGVAMLSSVLRSRRAVQVNIEIMRAFVRLREITNRLSSRVGQRRGPGTSRHCGVGVEFPHHCSAASELGKLECRKDFIYNGIW